MRQREEAWREAVREDALDIEVFEPREPSAVRVRKVAADYELTEREKPREEVRRGWRRRSRREFS